MRLYNALLKALFKALFALLAFTISLNASAAKDKQVRAHRGPGRVHGNERSERPGRIQIGDPDHHGNGCPAGTLSMALAPDNLSFSILYDQYIAQSDIRRKRLIVLMECVTVIPIKIPDGMRMEITQVTFRGFAGLPDKAGASIRSIYNFRGPGGDKDRMNLVYGFKGPLLEEYEVSSDDPDLNKVPDQSEVSPCGGDVRLRISTSVALLSSNKQEDASFTIDSVDGAAAQATYYVNWRKCRP
jgi:hypothetical protein